MPATIHYNELDPQTRSRLGIKRPAKPRPRCDVRGWALKVLASMHKLSRDERERVLDHAIRINAI